MLPRLRAGSPGSPRLSSCREAASRSWASARVFTSPWLSMRLAASRIADCHSVVALGTCWASHCCSSGLRFTGPTRSAASLRATRCSSNSCRSRRSRSRWLSWRSITCTKVRGTRLLRRCSRASLSTTKASFGATASKGAGTPGLRLGSASHGQLDTRATSRQTTSRPALSTGGQRSTGRRGDSLRSQLCQSRRRRWKRITAADVEHKR